MRELDKAPLGTLVATLIETLGEKQPTRQRGRRGLCPGWFSRWTSML